MTSHSREAKASSMVESDNELGERTMVTRELELCICNFPSKVLTVVELPRSKVFLWVGWLGQIVACMHIHFNAFYDMLLSLNLGKHDFLVSFLKVTKTRPKPR